jgi:hypothetical protein
MFGVTDKGIEEHGRSLRLPKRSEIIVELPVEEGEDGAEGIIDKLEIAEGISVASSLTEVQGNKAMTSILNTRDEEVIMDVPHVKWERYSPDGPDLENQTSYVGAIAPIEPEMGKNRENKVLANLRLDHLNSEERNVIENTCRCFRDIFYLKGDRLSCTNAIKHSINVIPGTSPINTGPYRLPDAQKRGRYASD